MPLPHSFIAAASLCLDACGPNSICAVTTPIGESVSFSTTHLFYDSAFNCSCQDGFVPLLSGDIDPIDNPCGGGLRMRG